MLAKELLNKIKKITHMHVLIVLFLMIIFILGAAALPSTLSRVWHLFMVEETDFRSDLRSLAPVIASRYHDSLDFDDPFLLNKGTYININGLMANLMGQRYMNERVKLKNGHLTYVGTDPYLDTSLAAYQLIMLNLELSDRGKSFLFVLAPGQISKYEDLMPIGFEADFNHHSDNLIAALRFNNVPVLDLREELHKDGIINSEALFKTDHHWRPETGFWAYGKIVEHLIEIGLIDPIDSKYTDINEYNVEVYKNWFLGTAGQRTGRYFAGLDDFSIITPKFGTNLSVDIPTHGISKQGDFSTVGFDHTANRFDLYEASPYNAYGHACRDYKQYINDNAPTDLSIMVIGDSHGNVAFTYLALVASSVTELDMRYYPGDFTVFFQNADPDIVIVLVGCDGVVNPNTTHDFYSYLHGR